MGACCRWVVVNIVNCRRSEHDRVNFRWADCHLVLEMVNGNQFPSSPDRASTRSYETDNPNLKSVPTKSFDLVLEWIKAPMKSGSDVSLFCMSVLGCFMTPSTAAQEVNTAVKFGEALQ